MPEAVLQRAVDGHGAATAARRAPAAPGLPPVHVVREGEPRVPALDQPAHAPARAGSWRARTAATKPPAASCSAATRQAGDRACRAGLRTGYYRLTLDGAPPASSAAWWSRRATATSPPALQQGERWWGCTIQLYALRSSRNWGIGDFGDLRRLVRRRGAPGRVVHRPEPAARAVPAQPGAASPYSPSSRKALNPIYLDVQTLVGPERLRRGAAALVQSEAFQDRLQRAARRASMVDYPGVAAAKEEVLRLLWRHFEQHDWTRTARAARTSGASCASARPTLRPRTRCSRRCRSTCTRRTRPSGAGPPGREAYRDPHGAAVQALRARARIAPCSSASGCSGWREVQLESLPALRAHARHGHGPVLRPGRGRQRRRRRDLGASRRCTRWACTSARRPTRSTPPGQDWGLPPLSPQRAARARATQPFIDTLRANMRHAGALRMDHVMAPDAAVLDPAARRRGTYVRYPLDDLLGILALESQRHHCLVIGEDLGTVAPAHARGACASGACCRTGRCCFERDGGRRLPPAARLAAAGAGRGQHARPADAARLLAAATTSSCGQRWACTPTRPAREQQVLDRAQDRARLLLALRARGPAARRRHACSPTSLPDATPALRRRASTPTWRARPAGWSACSWRTSPAQLLQVNVPGTTRGPLPQLAPQAARDRGGAGQRRALAVRWPPCCAPSAAARGRAAAPHGAARRWTRASVPAATYRVQFHEGCTLRRRHARPCPTCDALGISHLYSSPYLRRGPAARTATTSSTTTQLNPEIGDEAALRAPVPGAAPPRHGPDARHRAQPHGRAGGRQRLVARRAGTRPGLAPRRDLRHRMAAGAARDGRPRAAAGAGRPLRQGAGGRRAPAALRRRGAASSACATATTASRSTRAATRRSSRALPAPPARDDGEGDSHAVVARAAGRLRPAAAARRRPTPQARRARVRDSASTSASWRGWPRATTGCARWIDACVQRLNGTPGEPRSFDALDALIARAGLPPGGLARGRATTSTTAASSTSTRWPRCAWSGPRCSRPRTARCCSWLQDGMLHGPAHRPPRRPERPARLLRAAAGALRARRREVGGQPAARAVPGGGEDPGRARAAAGRLAGARRHRLPLRQPGQRPVRRRRATRTRCSTALPRLHRRRRPTSTRSLYECKQLIIETSLYSRAELAGRTRCTASRAPTGARATSRATACARRWPRWPPPSRCTAPTCARASRASAMDRRHIDWAIAAARAPPGRRRKPAVLRPPARGAAGRRRGGRPAAGRPRALPARAGSSSPRR